MLRTRGVTGSGLRTVGAVLAAVSLLGCGPAAPNSQPDGGEALPLSDQVESLAATGAVVGGGGLLRVTLPNPVRAATSLALTSSDPGVAAVPAAATVAPGSDTVEVPFEGKAVGYATLTAELGTSRRTIAVSVVPALALASAWGPSRPLVVGTSVTTTVYLNLVTATSVDISLTSSDPDVVTVPSAVTVTPFSSSATLALKGKAPGTATVTARQGDHVRDFLVTVVPRAQLQSFYLSPASTLTPGAAGYATVELSAFVPAGTVVALSSSNPAVARLPAFAAFHGGTYYSDVPFTALAAGATTLTAQLGPTALTETVKVVTGPRVTGLYIPASGNLVLGTRSYLLVGLDAVAPADQVVTLTSSAPEVAALPPTVTVPRGATSASASLTGAAVGTTLLSAELDGSVVSSVVTVVGRASLSAVNVQFPRVAVGAALLVQAQLSAVVPEDVPVALTAGAPGILALPASLTIPAGSNAVTGAVRAVGAGTTTIRFTVGDDAATVPITVVAAPTLAGIQVAATTVGTSGLLSVFTDVPVLRDLTVSLSQAPTTGGVLQMPAAVVIPSGKNRGTTFVQGKATGGLAVTATVGATSVSTAATVYP